MANLQLVFKAPVDDSWLYISGELVNDDDGTSYPFEQTVEFYSGSDSDGYWTEGSTTNALLIPAVPGGKYYLNLDTESGDFKNPGKYIYPPQYTVTVYRDVATYSNYFWCLFFVSAAPIWIWIMRPFNRSIALVKQRFQ